MSECRRREAPTLFLLRIGLGLLWVHDGLVYKVLAVGLHAAPAVGWPGLDLPLTVQARLIGSLEVVLGLLLLSGVLVRGASVVLCLLLALLTIEAAHAMPHALLRPMGVVSRNVVLGAAGLALALVPARDPARQERLLAALLRAGLGIMWLYEGLALKWLPALPAEVELFARSDVVPAEQVVAFVRMVGLLEALVGGAVLIGFRVRQLAVLQVGLLAALALLLGQASPSDLLAAPGGLSRHLVLIGCALILYQVGAGALALDNWLAVNRTSRRWRLVLTLHAAWLLTVCMIEVYRLQQPAAQSDVAAVLHKIAADDVHHAEDLRSLLRRHGGPGPIPGGAGLARTLAWLVGAVTVIAGLRAGLRANLLAKDRALSLYAKAARLLPAEEGLTARALQAMQDREAAHRRLLHESLHSLRRRR
jgi:uncharacterized membrane protein YphA (DoxX/SURF4 family)